jgi:hypothetical protein
MRDVKADVVVRARRACDHRPMARQGEHHGW